MSSRAGWGGHCSSTFLLQGVRGRAMGGEKNWNKRCFGGCFFAVVILVGKESRGKGRKCENAQTLSAI